MSPFSAKILNTVNAITAEQWQSLNCLDNTYFTPEFLEVYETSNPNIDFRYILILEDNKAIAIANIQIIDLGIDAILKNIKISERLKKIIDFFMCKNVLRIMFCGNIFLSGEHGIFLKKGVDKHQVFSAITKAIKELSITKELKPLHAIFVKDFYADSLHITDELKKYGYASMPVEPNMILKINSNWLSFDDYKADLKSKYRVKVNKADKTSSVLTVKHFSEDDFANHKDELQLLYENTIANANFNAQVLDLDTYIKLRALYKDDFIVKAYFYENKLVGFLSALINESHLDAHFIGLNYDLNRECAIYPRILNDYVKLGIQHNVSQINFGRTASEIKSTIGAKPENLMCYIRHKRKSVNRLLKPFFSKVQIKGFKEHYPFKS